MRGGPREHPELPKEPGLGEQQHCTDCNHNPQPSSAQGRGFLLAGTPKHLCPSGGHSGTQLSPSPFSEGSSAPQSPFPPPLSPALLQSLGLRFKGESTAGKALIPREGPAQECYRIFPWLFLLKHVHKQQHWLVQLSLSAFSSSRQGAEGAI